MRIQQNCAAMTIALSGLLVAPALAGAYSWQAPHARVLSTGGLEWAPTPFAFQSGAVVRHIDFEGGDDSRSGSTREQAWRHHPGDANASGLAKAATGVDTYVFKRGVIYRGALTVPIGTAGRPEAPIRLPEDVDPTSVTVEAARQRTLIDSKGMSHVEISGLAFRFGKRRVNIG